ncbi:GEVED domain-containing protein [uncultured Polaribacter sp.]|uniref:GEVED domain-containing protein n=1 Tax=uncultured Polaribacter sp. TaxID=174711 RepID=UPI002605037E|nr:GEVED domain-containing protein [uncultured Polaribacter sp.]
MNNLLKLALPAICIFTSTFLFSQTYCTPTNVGFGTAFHVQNVNLESINNSSIYTSTDGAGYSVYSGVSTSLAAGSSYSGSVTFTMDDYNNVDVKVWIDYNDNGDYTDSGEEIFTYTGNDANSSSGITESFSFTVPSGASIGETRMRVMIMRDVATVNPCNLQYQVGEIEDYIINTGTPVPDSDKDGVADNIDIDDDNDGILDTVESVVNVSSWKRGSAPAAVKIIPPVTNSITTNGDNLDWNDSYVSESVLDYGLNVNDFQLNFQTASVTGRRFMIGLNSYPNVNSSYTDIDYAIYVNNTTLHVYESGSHRGAFVSYTATDILSVKKEGNVITYLKNDVVFYTSLINATATDYFVDTSFADGVSTINNIQLDSFLQIDTDGDGVPNHLDIDSDNDGVTDNIEAQTTLGFIAPSGVDVDLDGLDRDYDADDTDILVSSVGLIPVNTDAAFTVSDVVPDYLDTDADNDAILDADESRNPILPFILADDDNDGLQDAYDTVDLNLGPAADNSNDGISTPITFFKDDEDPAVELDFRRFNDVDSDGVPDNIDLDNDNDGILDADECGFPSSVTVVPVNTTNSIEQTLTLPAGNKEVVFDIYRIDNSFSITVNGVDLAGEIQFTRSAFLPGHNMIEFSDGIAYGESGVTNIWTIGGSSTRVDLRISISSAGVLSLYGVRSTDEYAPLEELFLTTPALNAIWNLGTTNEIVFDQEVNGGTYITGETRYNEPCSSDAYNDGDGIVNKFDLDSDNDGITDVIEAGGVDANRDGLADGAVGVTLSTMGVPSSAGSGLTIRDSDNDGLPDFTDIDADNDGIPDNIEAQLSIDYTEPSGVGATIDDVNTNGLDDAYEVGVVFGIDPVNTDTTGNPDYFDLDSDDDLTLDIFENGDTDNLVLNLDSDGDGLDNAFDDNNDTSGAGYTVNDGLGVGNVVANVADLETAFADSDNDFPIPGSGDLDFRDATDSDLDGVGDDVDIDDDNDGILDKVESVVNVSSWTRGPAPAAVKIIPPTTNSITTNGINLDWNDSYASASVLDYGLNVNDFQLNFQTDLVSGRRFMIGLNSYPNINSSHTDIDYAIYINNTTLQVYESGASRGSFGSYASTDVLSVKKEGNVVTYLKNNVVFYASIVNATATDYFVDTSFADAVTTINNIQLDSFLQVDTDGDGVPNHLDIDSDNDGIPDNIEAQTTSGYIVPSGVDADLDGLDRDYDADDSNIFALSTGLIPVNTDGAFTFSDPLPDYLDTNSDNDAFLDIDESRNPTVLLVLADADNDGLQDNFDTVDLNLGPATDNSNNGIATPITFFKDDEDPTVQLDFRRFNDIDTDGVPDSIDLDNDNDGILDVDECGFPTSVTAIPVNVTNSTAQTFTLPAGNKEVVFDVYRINNSLSITVNGVDLAGEIQFYRPAAFSQHNMVHFSDGINYGASGVTNVWSLGGSAFRVDLRISISSAGVLTLSGVRSSNELAPLEELLLTKPALNAIWNTGSTNEIVIDQELDGSTFMTGELRYNNPCTTDAYNDGDSIVNKFDLDSDNDGILDVIEAQGIDADRNGIADGTVGITTSTMGVPSSAGSGLNTIDTDEDGLPNFTDIDADNDGIPDNIEAQLSTSYIEPSGIGAGIDDVNTNGLDDAYEAGIVFGIDPVNTDTTGNPDYFDLDSDDDLTPDILENGDTDNVVLNIDSDGDGLDNAFDDNNDISGSGYTVNDGLGVGNTITDVISLEAAFADTDNDFPLPGTGELDFRDATDTDFDSVGDNIDIDDDNDGILDAVESIVNITDWTRGPLPSAVKIIPPTSNSITTNSDNLDWNDSYASSSVISYGLNVNDFQLNFQTDAVSGRRFMIGLNSYPNVNSSFNDIDYAIYINNTTLYIYESGTSRGIFGSYTATDILSVKKEGNVIKYVKNDVAFYTSLITANATDYFVDTSFADGVSTIKNIQLESFLQIDSDGDGLPNHKDIDSDNDGIPDNIEAQPTATYTAPDADNLSDYTTNNGLNSAYIGGIIPVDTEGDGTPDYRDTDSDNDRLLDIDERLSPTVALVLADADNDGFQDVFEDPAVTFGLTTINTNQNNDITNLGTFYLNLTDPGGELDYRNAVDTDLDGVADNIDIDDDNDGILDTAEEVINIYDWTRGIGARVTKVIQPVATNTITTNTNNSGWNDSYISQGVLSYGLDVNSFQFSFETAAVSGRRFMIGLNSYPNVNSSYTDIDYAIYIANTSLLIYENGSYRGGFGSFASTDVFSIKKEGNLVTYLKNDIVFYTSLIPANAANYFIDNSFANTGVSTIENIQLTSIEPLDIDQDGIPNRLDLDSDNDGIPDNIEAQSTLAYNDPNSDNITEYITNNGLNTRYIAVNNGGVNGLLPVNTDGVDTPDYIDLDADDDGIFDIVESGSGLTDADTDGKTDGTIGINGLDNTLESLDDFTDVNGNFNDPENDFTNTSGSGDVDYRKFLDSDSDGVGDDTDLDDDNDGILDIIENTINVNNWSRGPGATVVKVIPPEGTNAITTNGNSASWNDSFTSPGVLSYGLDVDSFKVSFQSASTTGRRFMIGLNAFPNVSSSYTDIDYQIYFDQTTIRVFENGSNRGTFGAYSASDIFSIKKEGSVITYLKNDVVFYTSVTAATATDYFIDTSFHGAGVATIENIQLIPLSELITLDSDEDGVPNRLDLDSDNDGIPDNIEAQTTAGYTLPVADTFATYLANNGVNSAYIGGLTPENTDNTDYADYLDLDADDDDIFDIVESGSGLIDANTDGKTDGIVGDNGFDNSLEDSDDYTDVNGDFNDPENDFTNTNSLGDVDYRQTLDTDFDGIEDTIDIDDDNDGILDTEENAIDVNNWERGPNATVVKVIPPVATNTIITNGGGSSWNDSFASQGILSYGLDVNSFQFSFQSPSLSGRRYMIGLNSYPNVNSSYTDIDYAIYINHTGLTIYESGSHRGNFGSYTATDILSIKKDGNTITYLKNDVVFYTSLINATATDYFIDNSFADAGISTIENIQVSSILPLDTDGDSIPNSLDLDSDNDGIPDNVEAQTTAGYTLPATDTYATYLTNNGLNSAYLGGITPENTDQTNNPDYLDLDADDDGVFDIIESGTGLTDVNTDGKTDATVGINGLDDTLESIDDYTDVNGVFNDPENDFTNTNGVGEVDYRQTLDTDFDGIEDAVDIDDDNDGILDTEENKININEWTRGVGATVSKVMTPVISNTLITNGNNANWNDSYASPGVISYGFDINAFQASFQTPSLSGRRFMIGLNSYPNVNSSFNDIDFAIYIDQTTIRVYENGSHRGAFGSYTASDVFSIKKEGNVVTYLKNDVVFYTSSLNATATDYFIDTSFHGAGVSTIQNIQLSSILLLYSLDTDGDGIPNDVDLDSDNDGIPDNVEAQTTAGYILPAADSYATYLANNGINSAYIGGLSPVNTDAEDNSDYLDLDSDNDEILDIVESGSGLTDANTDGKTDGTVGDNGFDNTLEDSDNYADVNGDFNDPENNFTNTNLTGDVDYRESIITDNVMITQVYHSSTDRWIEVTNISTSITIAPNSIKVVLFDDKSGDQTGVTPDASFAVTATLAPGQSVLINKTGNTITNINGSASNLNSDSLTAFSGGNDIIALSSVINEDAWTNRFDVVSNITDNTSFVRADQRLAPNSTYTSSEWVVFIDDALNPYANPPERHPFDPLISAVNTTNTNLNVQLGTHRINGTTRSGSTWTNGEPDRSRFVIIGEDYNHTTGTFIAKDLAVSASNTFSITDNLLVVTNAISLNGDIRLISTNNNNLAQLIQTHQTTSQVIGSGRLLIDQNSEVPSKYRYNYMSSPVQNVALGSSYTIANVFKDGTVPTNASGTINTDIAKDINFLTGNIYDGDTTSPISLADYWMYTYAPSSNGMVSWSQTRSGGAIPNTDGFIFKGPGVAQNYTFIGSPKDGNLESSSFASGDSYLIGNPYASALSAKKFIEDNLAVTTATLYFWQHVGEVDATGSAIAGHTYAGYIGGYATKNLVGGVAANSPTISGPFDISLQAEAAITTGSVGASDVLLDAISEEITFNSIIRGVDELIINYNSSASKMMELYIDGVSNFQFTLPSSSGVFANSGPLTVCIPSGSDITLVSKDAVSINIDFLRLQDADGNISCQPFYGGAGDQAYKEPEGYIAIGQGFFIETNAAGSVVFNNSQREYVTEGANSVFFKNDSKSEEISKIKSSKETVGYQLPSLKLGMDYLNAEGNSFHRQLGLSFNAGNSFAFDKGYDSEMFDLGDTDMYFTSDKDEVKYVMSGVNQITSDLEVPFDILMDYTGSIILNIDEIKNIDEEIYLRDNQTDKTYVLSEGSVALQLNKGLHTNRFEIVFTNDEKTVLSDDTIAESVTEIENLEMYLDNTSKEIVLKNKAGLFIKKVQLFNLLGQRVHQWKINDSSLDTRLDLGNISNQIYILKVLTDKNEFSKKVLYERY